MKERLLREFAERFGNAEGTYAVVRKRQDKRLFFYSMNYP